jgi:protein-S-isoprenylcysteine O-methyltransferase Ste14
MIPTMMVLRHLLSILILPTTVTLVVPYFILSSELRVARFASSLWPLDLLAIALGGVGMAAGLTLVVATVRHFAVRGKGTLAPWDPPKNLVVAGIYRYVRNPMISGVLAILFGEAVLFRSVGLLEWAIGFFLINSIYIPLFEERQLESRFGDGYLAYKRNVPRWIPRRHPWESRS